MKRRLLAILLGAIAAGVAATPALGKEGVEATLETSIPLNASPGEQVTVAWTLASVDERGKRQPFGAGGVFIRLVSASGEEPTTSVASGDNGEYEATVRVPEGGIGGVAIGLHGISSGPTGTSQSDVYFPVTNNPLPAPTLAQLEVRDDVTPARPTGSGSNGLASTWVAVLVVAPLLALGSLAIVLRNRRRVSAPAARRP